MSRKLKNDREELQAGSILTEMIAPSDFPIVSNGGSVDGVIRVGSAGGSTGEVVEISMIASALSNETGKMYAVATTERATEGGKR